jgi:peptidyl-prolyl cis-trans isomerase SurA
LTPATAGAIETVDIAMPMLNVTIRTIHRWLVSAVVALALTVPSLANAQVVVIANGSPITELDIQQRMKLVVTSSRTKPTRQEIINDLIDDRLKIAKAKVYGLEVSDTEVDQAFENMAKRQRISAQQFAQAVERAGIMPSTIKARLRSELTWNQLVRGKYGSSLQVGESDIAKILRDRKDSESAAVGYVYTLYPITFVVGRGLSEGAIEAKRREAENLRSRFLTCNEGLPLARALRDVAVREPISRSSTDLAPQLRDLLSNIEVGRLTVPEMTEQGLQMFALCAKKESAEDTPAKREAREQLYSTRFESEAKKFLDEIRKQAMIEYK